MAKKAQVKAVVKKVSPYPIDVQLSRDGKILYCKIIKITTKGFFADLDKEVVQINSFMDSRFTLPVFKTSFSIPGRATKFIDRIVKHTQQELAALKPGEKLPVKIKRIVEFHFVGISDDDKKRIQMFCQAIHQDEI